MENKSNKRQPSGSRSVRYVNTKKQVYSPKNTRSMSKNNQNMENPFTPFQIGHLYIYKNGVNKKLNLSDNNTYQYDGKDQNLLIFTHTTTGDKIKFTDNIDAGLHMKKKAWTGGKSIKKRTEKKTTRKNKNHKK